MSFFAISSSSRELFILDLRPTIPPTKQARCWTSVSRCGGAELALREPGKRMSGLPGRVGRKKRFLLNEERAVRYMLRYCWDEEVEGRIR